MKLLYAALLASATPWSLPAEAFTNSVWSITLVKVKPGELDHYVAFLKQNWKQTRAEAIRRGSILSYKMMLTKTSQVGRDAPHVLLMTEYPSAAAYANREQIFAPILKARRVVTIDGRTSRDFVETMTELSGTES